MTAPAPGSVPPLYGSTANLIIACAGAGILAFPYAMFEAGVLLGTCLSLSLMALNIYSNRIVVRMSCPIFKGDSAFPRALYAVRSIQGGAQLISPNEESIRIMSFIDLCHVRLGPRYGTIARITLFIGTLGALIAFLIITADVICPVLRHYISAQSFFATRTFVTVSFVLFVAFPLSTLPNLESLAISSIIAVATIAFVALVVVVESFKDDFLRDISHTHLVPATSTSVFGVIPIMVFAFACNVQVVPVMGELPWVGQGQRQGTVTAMYSCVRYSLMICAAMYIIVGVFGYVQFGTDTDGVILDDYSSGDVLANLGRLSMVLHIALAYPVILYPAQQNVLRSIILPLYSSYVRRTAEKSISSASSNVSSAMHCRDESLSSTADAAETAVSPSMSLTVDPKREVSCESNVTTSATDSPVRIRGNTSSFIHPISIDLSSVETATVVDGQPPVPLPLRLGSALSVAFLTTLIALALPQATVVFGLCGSLVGSTLVLIMPALMALWQECGAEHAASPGFVWHRAGAYLLLSLGLVVTVGGTALYCMELGGM